MKITISTFERIEDYIENIEMFANRENLVKKYQESVGSGLSDFVIKQ